jgi:cephalosporin hydroxylase
VTVDSHDAKLRARMWQVAWQAINHHGAQQRLDELTEILARLHDMQPRVVVEIGSASGGTLFAWGCLGVPHVYAVTLRHPADGALHGHGAVVLEGDSHDRATLQRLKDQLGGRPVDVLFIDGDHSYEGAAADFAMYSPLVRDGGLVLFHDIRHNWPGVTRFWSELAAREPVEEVVSKSQPAGFGIVRVDRGANRG